MIFIKAENVALKNASKFKKDYDPKWRLAYEKLEHERNFLYGVLVKDDDDWELCETYKGEIKKLEAENKELQETVSGQVIQSLKAQLSTSEKARLELEDESQKQGRENNKLL